MSEQQVEQQFEINRIYIKDVSVETPNTPEVFTWDWEPELNVNLANAITELEGESDLVEVALTLTVTVMLGEKTAYVVEVEQAGIFTMTGFDDEHKAYLIGAMIPNILFPYARETISSLTQKAGFPPMLLNPIDFNALYHQHLQEQAGEEAAAE
ncbi:MAG: protein-export chaperone SecB [Gammaproteobacteria bacterium]|nr:MAG: protein-export chaperone SecB [Gammaproteobacteria bacterium]